MRSRRFTSTRSVLYLSGPRAAWVKHKHRREQLVVVLGRRASDGRSPETFPLGREDRDGHIRYAGDAALGLAPRTVSALCTLSIGDGGNPTTSFASWSPPMVSRTGSCATP